jgi:GldM C-terminal domain
MKHILGFLLLLLGTQKVQSQLIVMNDKMNIVYYGVENPISFSVNGYDSKQLILKASCGELRKTAEGYVWKICGEKVGRVSFSCTIKKGNKITNLGQSEFRIKKAPDPIIMYTPSSHSGNVSKMFNIRYLRAEVFNFDFDIRFSVKKFDVEIYKSNGDTLKYHIEGAELGALLGEEIIKLIPGEKVCFKNVFVKNAGCESDERELENICDVYHE